MLKKSASGVLRHRSDACNVRQRTRLARPSLAAALTWTDLVMTHPRDVAAMLTVQGLAGGLFQHPVRD